MSVCLSVLFLLSPIMSCVPSVPCVPRITHVPRVLHIPGVFMFLAFLTPPVFLVFPVSIVFLPMFPVLLWFVSCLFLKNFFYVLVFPLPSLLILRPSLSTFCWLPSVFAFCIFLFLLDFASPLHFNKACFIFTCLPLGVLRLGPFMIFMYSLFKSHQHNNHS